MVARLRKSPTFIPTLSLVARLGTRVIGYALLTPVQIGLEEEQKESLALAPLAITPVYQGKKIGTYLLQAAHRKALELGYKRVVVLGPPNYYQRIGYKMASAYGIQIPFDKTGAYSLVLEITPNALEEVEGMVIYPKAFYE
ncbi:MAG: GNAT family N-acetyltransferase [Aureispira sp.]